jgi:hypothetical protein
MSRTFFRLTGFLLPGLVLLFPAGILRAHTQDGQSQWPNERERGSYQAKIASTGKLLWRVDWETKVTKEQGRSQVEVQEQGQGTPWRAKETLVWKKTLRFEEGPVQPAMRVQSVIGSRWTQGGRPVSDMDFEVDPALRRISYRDAETGRKPQSVVLPWTSQSIPDELLFHWVRTLPFQEAVDENRPASEFTLVVSPRRQFRIKAKIQGTEMVTTPAGRFSCYRINLVPQLPGPLKALAPRISLWCRTDPPNYWVRYQGPVGGPGSPEAVIELVEFEQG